MNRIPGDELGPSHHEVARRRRHLGEGESADVGHGRQEADGRDVLAHDRAEEVGPLGEQGVDAPVVGEEAGHVHQHGRGGEERREHRQHGTRGERVGRAAKG